jgi:hypothetical protein
MKRLLVCLSILVCAGALAAAAGAAVLNGGFESDFDSWSSDSTGSGAWQAFGGANLPFSGHTALPPFGGSLAATFDQSGPSSGVLYQDVTVEPGAATLSFWLAYDNQAEEWVDPGSLDTGVQNQQIRVDVLDLTADPWSTDPADVLATVFRSADGMPFSQGYQRHTFDLSPWVGQTVRLRFAAADTLFYLSVAVDDVQLVPYAQENRAGYCSAPGNASNGHELAPGSFLDLVVGQPSVDPQYAGATTARWIDGLGITCDNVPAGFTEQGSKDGYPFFAKA